MHQTKKGNQWFFGMKAHIGVDADSGLVHTVTTTAANEADVEQVADLLHGKEEQVWADSGYRGAAPSRVDHEDLQWHIAARPSDIAKLPAEPLHDCPPTRCAQRVRESTLFRPSLTVQEVD